MDSELELLRSLMLEAESRLTQEECDAIVKHLSVAEQKDIWMLVHLKAHSANCKNCKTAMFGGDIVWRKLSDNKQLLHNYMPCKGVAAKTLLEAAVERWKKSHIEEYDAAVTAIRLGGVVSLFDLIESLEQASVSQ